jgi:hypothetical protein
MTPNQGPDLQTLHPGNDSKFSVNLYKFLSGRRHQASLRLQRVFVDQDKHLWLGYFDDDLFIGTRLMHVLCNGANAQKSAFIRMQELVEVPDFWQKYQAIGRCAIDPEHRMSFTGDETRWRIQGEHRSCLWCGEGHQQQRVTQDVRTVWVPAAAEACAA